MATVVDVFFYSQTGGKPAAGVANDYPAKCIEIDDSQPVTPNATRMTIAQFNAYKASRLAAYETAVASVKAAAVAAQAVEDKFANFMPRYIRALMERDLAGNSAPLTALQSDWNK